MKAGGNMLGIQTGNFDYLHFSDLHLTTKVNSDTELARKRLVEFLKNKTSAGDLPCDYIFITGDIAYKNDYSGAKAFIEKIFESLKWNQNKYNQVFWAVGNHDISRKNMLREIIISHIRGTENAEKRFEECMRDPRVRSELFMGDMSDYYKWHEESHLYDHSNLVDITDHKLHKLPNLNLITLNTCLTSCDDNDNHNLHIVETKLFDVFENIDINNPTFVMGHHGKGFFTDETQHKLGHLFGSKNVDLYLCGHSHRPGYDAFLQTKEDVHQITSGGGVIDGYSVLSFMHGHYDREEATLTVTPYSYADRGNRDWSFDGALHARLDGLTPLQLRRIDNVSKSKNKTKVSLTGDSGLVQADSKTRSASFFTSAAPILKKERSKHE